MFTPGDRCIITKSYCGDEGRIVTFDGYVNGPYMEKSLVWRDSYWHECDCVITPVDGVLHSVNFMGIIGEWVTRPHSSKHLRKLPDVEEEVKKEIEVTV